MAFILVNILFFINVVIIKCSQVVDIEVQKKINVTDYCSDISGCEEGTHVMCLHYNPNRLMGPSCSGAVNITITPDYADLILSVMNKIRSRVTKGIVKGKDGVNLPKAYGVYRLGWDEELATFAQVWANQCRLASDLCRASKKFPNVGQALGLSRFTVYGWRPISLPDSPNSTDITPEKVKYAITSVMSAWYSTKNQVTPEHIKNFGDGSRKMRQNQFLHLVYENVTHIGCGISGYREYVFNSDHVPLYHNSVQIVCNFSSRFQTGTRIYTTEPPTQTGYTVKCGCPLGYDEDEDCLCYETGRQLPYSCKDNNRCKPAVAVLPIFHMEDAPKEPRALTFDKRIRHNNTTQLLNNQTNEIFGRYDLVNNHKTTNKHEGGNKVGRYRISKGGTYHADVRRRYFDINRGLRKKNRQTLNPYRVSKNGKSRRTKQSVFSIAPIFELSIRKMNPIKHENIFKNYKKDVAPRRDFTEAKKLLLTYLDKKRSSNTFEADKEPEKHLRYEPTTINSIVNTSVSKVYKESKKKYDGHQNIGIDDQNLTTIIEKTENEGIKLKKEVINDTFTTLLDKLVTEISEKPLNIKEKQIFHNKISKIYGSVIGGSGIEDKFKVVADSNNVSNIDERGDYHLKPYDSITSSININRDEYFESVPPKDRHRSLRRRFENDNIASNLSKDNDNTGLNIIHPILNENYNEFDNEGIRNLYNVKKRPEANFRKDLSARNFYLRNFDNDGFIGVDRRKFYDSKLANLRKKINLMKIDPYKTKVHKNRKLRPVRPTKLVGDQNTQKGPKEALNSFYVADRARFLHGF